MLRKLLLGAIGALAFAGVASAADLPVKGPVYKAVPAPVFTWSGFYVGVSGGWSRLDTEVIDTAGRTSGPLSDNGWLIGGTIGYNWQRPGSSFVWGFEADLSYVNLNPVLIGGLCGPGCGTEQNLLGTLRLRAGFAANNWLFYATAGGAAGGFDSFVVAVRNSETLWGWTVGLGTEVALNNRWSTKLEYLYIQFEDGSVPTLAPVTVGPLEQHVVRLGVNYRW